MIQPVTKIALGFHDGTGSAACNVAVIDRGDGGSGSRGEVETAKGAHSIERITHFSGT